MSSKRPALDTIQGDLGGSSPDSKRRRTEQIDAQLSENSFGVHYAQVLTPQPTSETSSHTFAGFETECSQPAAPYNEPFPPSIDDDFLAMDQLIDFSDSFEVESGEKGQPLFGDLSKANTGAACDIEVIENAIFTKSMDEKVLDQLMEEMVATEDGEPPSSVLRAVDRSSRSAEDFDPKLQHSPVSDNSTGKYLAKEEESLDYEVDWNPVCQFSRQIGGSSSQGPSGTTYRKSLAAPSTTPSTLQPSNTKPSPGTWAA
jgi:hypothetical protein